MPGEKEAKAFQDMLIMDQLRGVHSTGVFAVRRHISDTYMAKALGTPDQLIDTKSYDRAYSNFNRLMMGHNRYATVGKVSLTSAHPFDIGGLVGMHNGTLTNYAKLDGYGEFGVDSQVLYNHINENGLQDAVNECSGAMALIWWDKDTQCLNVYRNSQRPLYVAYTKDGTTGFLASEPWMISGATWRNNVSVVEIQEVPPEHHFQWSLPQGFNGKLPVAEVKEVKKEVTYFQPQGNFASNWKKAEETTQETAKAGTTVTTIPELIKNKHHDSLVKAKSLVLECVDFLQVKKHNLYEFCEVKLETNARFVLYCAGITEKLAEGAIIVADVNGFMRDPDGGECLYVLNSATAQVVSVGDDEEVSGELFKASNGTYMSEEDWRKRHTGCENCFGAVDPNTAKFTKGGQVICEECHTNPVLSQVLQMA